MREDILFGLRNAVDRGVKLEQATRSFISAGYNAEEVNAAAKELSSGTASAILYPEQKTDDDKKISPLPKMTLGDEKKPDEKKIVVEEKKKSRKILIVSIAVSAAIILATIGYLIYALLT